MQARLQGHSWMNMTARHFSFGKEMGWGMIGGLVATIVMDFILIGAFMAAGMAPFTCFSLVGDTVARLFSYPQIANNAALGAAAHYLIGPLLGAIFGVAGRSVHALQAGSWRKAIVFAALYAEIVSQPMLAMTPILLQMTLSETLLWYGGSFGMHLIWGCVLGLVWSVGRHLPVAATRR